MLTEALPATRGDSGDPRVDRAAEPQPGERVGPAWFGLGVAVRGGLRAWHCGFSHFLTSE